jgi:integrase
MPKIAKALSAKEVNAIKTAGWHAVGGVAGLLLQVRDSGKSGLQTRSWILRTKIGSKRQPIGLGSYPQKSLAEARESAKQTLATISQGINPITHKKELKSALLAAEGRSKTFKQCAEAYITSHKSEYKSEKHRKQWATTIETYAYPTIGNMLVADITMRKVLDVLLQKVKDQNGKELGTLWEVRTVTAARLQGRIKTVLDYAIVNEYRSGTNPALWAGYLDTQLPSPNKKEVKHQPAVPYQQIGIFMGHLKKNKSISAKALEFLILTAVRSGAVRNANWSEIDYENKLWTIPKENTKTKKFEHRVPLSDQAVALLRSLPVIQGNSKVFPSPRGVSLSDMSLSEIMRGMRERGEFVGEGVPHGFRSTFRDWAAEQTSYPDEIRKAASGHLVGDAVQQAYQRTDLLEKRRSLMQDWSNFLDQLTSPKSTNVTPIRRRA